MTDTLIEDLERPWAPEADGERSRRRFAGERPADAAVVAPDERTDAARTHRSIPVAPMVQRSQQRVRHPETYPVERILVGRLHLLRMRLDDALADLGHLVADGDRLEQWERVEEAARLARRALVAAVTAAPPHATEPSPAELCVGLLRVDPLGRRQWYGQAEVGLTPLQHLLLATMAAEPFRVFGKDELSRLIWRRPNNRTNSVNTCVSRLRRALVAAGAPRQLFLLSVHGRGWALTRPD